MTRENSEKLSDAARSLDEICGVLLEVWTDEAGIRDGKDPDVFCDEDRAAASRNCCSISGIANDVLSAVVGISRLLDETVYKTTEMK